MTNTLPIYHIDREAFWHDPYPDLKTLRHTAPVALVPELGAVLITRRDDIFQYEKMIEVFSSDQPDGLMNILMGQNMMRKDGPAHLAERRAIFPAMSPKTVKDHWQQQFIAATSQILDTLAPRGAADLVQDYAMPVSAQALIAMTGLTNMIWREMDRVSQGMIDGCSNYHGDPETTARCHDCTASIERHIEARMPALRANPDRSLLSVQMQADLSQAQIHANLKLAISGGQNEPRDAIAGAAWAVLHHPKQYALIKSGAHSWMDAFEEYARWMSPIGMSPRRVTQDYEIGGVPIAAEARAFFMFGSGNRDAAAFAKPDLFDLGQDRSKAISFGAGPHFCAGAWAARCLIGQVALPMLFERCPDLALSGEAVFGGWAFRGPLSVPVRWTA